MFLREKDTVQIIRPPEGGRYKGNGRDVWLMQRRPLGRQILSSYKGKSAATDTKRKKLPA